MRVSSPGPVGAGPVFRVMVIAALAAPVMARAAGAPGAKPASPAVIEVGTARSAPGKTVRGSLDVGERSDGTPIRLPVAIVSGRKPGPVVWINALAHGNEYGGARALQETVRRLDPETIAGHVVAVLVSNPLAFQGLQRVNPDLDDLEDMGSAYPGNPAGFATERLVAALNERVRAQANYFIDLHTGGDHFKQHPFVLYTPNPGVPAERYDDLARSFGVPTLWRDTEGTFKKDGIITFSAAGIPSFLLEVGGEPLDPADVRLQSDAILGFLAGAGVMPGPAHHLASYTIVTGYGIVTNSRGGFFEAAVRPGDRLHGGDSIGTIRDVFGDVVETLRAPSGAGIVLGIANYPAVPTGGWLAEVGTGLKESP